MIPKQALCDRLVTVVTDKYRVLGYPVCLVDPRYDRNEFIFNFGIVLEEDKEFSVYKSVVRKLAKMFKALEEQTGWLSGEWVDIEHELAGCCGGADGGGGGGGAGGPGGPGGVGGEEQVVVMRQEVREELRWKVVGARVYALIEQVLEDLNNYSECMIPIGEFSWRTPLNLPAVMPSNFFYRVSSLFLPANTPSRRIQHHQHQALPDLRPAASRRALPRPRIHHRPLRAPHRVMGPHGAAPRAAH